jgi:hypothetical protein
MGPRRHIRILSLITLVLSALAVSALIAFKFATQSLKEQIERALGPESEVAELVVGWSAIELRGVRIRGPKGWPATDALYAERVVIKPDLVDLLSARVRISRITVEKPYLSVLRTRDGSMRLLPSLLEAKREAGSSAPAISIGSIQLHDGVLEFFDATVRQPAHKTRLERLQVTVDDVRVPMQPGRTGLRLEGAIKGVQRDGTLAISGWADLATRDSEIKTTLRGVDLIALQPYLIKTAEAGIRRGTLELDLHSTVRNNRLHAPGKATLSNLELSSASSPFATFMGVPRQAMVSSLKNRDGRISIKFTLEGNLDDPKFSINENFALRMGAAVGEGLGISLEGLTHGVGGAAEGIGGAVKRLFSR